MEDDLDVVVGWQEHLDSVCSCGYPRAESFDPENADRYQAEPLQCHACAKRDAESRRAAKAKADGRFSEPAFDGLYITVTESD